MPPILHTLKSVKNGFEKYYSLNGRYPTALEIDRCEYLPSSRQIQRNWGGLKKFRELIGLEISDYSSGINRHTIGLVSNNNARNTEIAVRNILINIYGEVFVHEEKKYGKLRNRIDFFIYASNNFGVEVFNTSNRDTFMRNMYIKMPKYVDFEYPLYYVVTGGNVTQEEIDKSINNFKSSYLRDNHYCMNIDHFNKHINSLPKPLIMKDKYSHIY